MSQANSITRWLEQLKDGERAVVQELWQEYFAKLVRLARNRLNGTPRQASDEEDVALSAFKSFCLGAEAGTFPRLADRHDLWQVLVVLTVRKAANLANHEFREKRGGGKVHHGLLDARDEPVAFADLVSREPDPKFAFEVAERLEELLRRLGDPKLQSIATLKMEGRTNEEIATHIGCSPPTIERKLALIRAVWQEEAFE